jgi:hypothetical protein
MKQLSRLITAVFPTVSLLQAAWAADILHVSPQVAADGAGTPEQPVTLTVAVQRASTDTGLKEIILAGGEYFVSANIQNPKAEGSAPLLIRAAEGATPVLHHAIRITEAEAVPGVPGCYRSKQMPPSLAHMWEKDTRQRYISLATKASVAAYPGSAFADPEEQHLYFHTSDGKPPQEHEVYLSLSVGNGRVLGIYRTGTTVEGLTVRDYVGSGQGMVMHGTKITFRRCRLENCNIGIAVGEHGTGYLIEDCTFRDTAQGVRSEGPDLVVRRCHFEKKRDAFLIPVYPTLDTGVYLYFPAKCGIITDNFFSGYNRGIRVKTGGRAFVLRHNTIVNCSGGDGISWEGSWPDSDVSYNIITQAENFIDALRFDPGIVLDHNFYWKPTRVEQYLLRETAIRGANLGQHNMLADPRFVDPGNGDYRLLPDSPAVLCLKDADGRPAGAFPVAPIEAAAKARPTLQLDFEADSMPYGPSGVLTFDRDPWIGGGTTRVRELTEAGRPPQRLTGLPEATVVMRAADATGKIVKTRVTVAEEPPQETAYTWQQQVKLPDKDGEYRMRCEVQNERGTWSEPAVAFLRLERTAPAPVDRPEVIANDNGLIVAFETRLPCQAEIRFGPTGNYGRVVRSGELIKRSWDPGDGGEWIETWTIPRTSFALAILKPEVEAGQTVHFQVVLTSEAGLKSESRDFTAKMGGQDRSIFVATGGADSPGRGTRAAPLRTVQYAVDRALPGDRVVLLPGLYAEGAVITHGGLSDQARLTIEAETAGTVTMDTAKREHSVLALEKAGYITIRNIRFLYYRKAGVYAYRAPHVTVEDCTFFTGTGEQGYHTFFFWSPHGTVIRCLAIGGETGLVFLQSPHATVTHNTVSKQLYAAAAYHYSLAGTVQMNNNFYDAGNDAFSGCIQHPEELKTFRSDYNNLGGSGKRLASLDKAYRKMEEWQAAYGQDKHSLLADPKFVKPIVTAVDSWDWTVKPDSPNTGAGENGATIGAYWAATNAGAVEVKP